MRSRRRTWRLNVAILSLTLLSVTACGTSEVDIPPDVPAPTTIPSTPVPAPELMATDTAEPTPPPVAPTNTPRPRPTGTVIPTPTHTAAPTDTPLTPVQTPSVIASPDPVERGGTVTVSWNAPGASSVGITRMSEEGDIFLETEALDLPAKGSITLQVPEDYIESVKYTLGARDAEGTLRHAYVTVGIICPYGAHIAPRCPLAQDSVWAAHQPFERGQMVWRSDTREIYVLFDNRTYEVYQDTWLEGDPINLPATPPPALFAPERGFGNLYANQPHLQESLGWATAAEVGYTMMVETIPGGSGRYRASSTFFALPDGRVISLYPFSSTWQFFP